MSEKAKDALSRWLPTIIAIIAIVGNILWLGAKAGALEQRIIYVEASTSAAVSRAEYIADRTAAQAMYAEMKQNLRDISQKLDRIVEARAR